MYWVSLIISQIKKKKTKDSPDKEQTNEKRKADRQTERERGELTLSYATHIQALHKFEPNEYRQKIRHLRYEVEIGNYLLRPSRFVHVFS